MTNTNYALELLTTALRNEHLAKGAAYEYLQGPQASRKANFPTIEAFEESIRLAKERIPQLDEAIHRISMITQKPTTFNIILYEGGKFWLTSKEPGDDCLEIETNDIIKTICWMNDRRINNPTSMYEWEKVMLKNRDRFVCPDESLSYMHVGPELIKFFIAGTI